MSIQRQNIDEAAEAVRTAQDALKAAVDNHVQAITTEATRLVSERLKQEEKHEAAAANLRSISAEKQNLEADNERYRASYLQAMYEGDETAAENFRAAGDVAREQLETVRTNEDEARRSLEAVSFDEDAADEQLRYDLSALKNMLPEDKHEDFSRHVLALMRPLKAAMQERAEARTLRTREENAARRRRVEDPYRDAHGVVHVPKGGIKV